MRKKFKKNCLTWHMRYAICGIETIWTEHSIKIIYSNKYCQAYTTSTNHDIRHIYSHIRVHTQITNNVAGLWGIRCSNWIKFVRHWLLNWLHSRLNSFIMRSILSKWISIHLFGFIVISICMHYKTKKKRHTLSHQAHQTYYVVWERWRRLENCVLYPHFIVIYCLVGF